jgi:septal ring factor EnvC (AmiA/AmiB activator)
MDNESRDEADYTVREKDEYSSVTRGQIVAYIGIILTTLIAVWAFSSISKATNQIRDLEKRLGQVHQLASQTQELQRTVSAQATQIDNLKNQIAEVESRLPRKRPPTKSPRRRGDSPGPNR